MSEAFEALLRPVPSVAARSHAGVVAAIPAKAARRSVGESPQELNDRLVYINRVTKVVKGGRRFSFAALVVVGDGQGLAGFGHGKAREVPEAIRKATEQAKQNLHRVPLKDGRSLHADVFGRHGAGKVLIRAAQAGTGIIAGGTMRAVFEAVGLRDVVAKSLGSNNPHNLVRATFAALESSESLRTIARRRGLKVSQLAARRQNPAALAAAP